MWNAVWWNTINTKAHFHNPQFISLQGCNCHKPPGGKRKAGNDNVSELFIVAAARQDGSDDSYLWVLGPKTHTRPTAVRWQWVSGITFIQLKSIPHIIIIQLAVCLSFCFHSNDSSTFAGSNMKNVSIKNKQAFILTYTQFFLQICLDHLFCFNKKVKRDLIVPKKPL